MIDCSKTKNYFAEKQRMTKKKELSDVTYTCKLDCTKCPLSCSNNGMNIPCTNLEKGYPDKAIAIMQKWSDEHPQKTYLSEFLKHYPNVKLLGDGTPKCLCPHQLGLKDIDDCRKHYTCAECWNQPMPIKDGESK